MCEITIKALFAADTDHILLKDLFKYVHSHRNPTTHLYRNIHNVKTLTGGGNKNIKLLATIPALQKTTGPSANLNCQLCNKLHARMASVL